jgi:hypothetical protein
MNALDEKQIEARRRAIAFAESCIRHRRISIEAEVKIFYLAMTTDLSYAAIARVVGLKSKDSVRYRLDEAYREKRKADLFAYQEEHRARRPAR